MKYRYDHAEMMAAHGMRRCTECQGDGYLNTSRHRDGEFYTDCPKCEGTGWFPEGFGLKWKRIKRQTKRIAA